MGVGGLNFIHDPVVSDTDADSDSILVLFFKISSYYWGKVTSTNAVTSSAGSQLYVSSAR